MMSRAERRRCSSRRRHRPADGPFDQHQYWPLDWPWSGAGLPRLLAGGGHERLRVVQGDAVQDDLREQGWFDLMNDSEQQVHSWKWNQTTGSRGLVSKALTTWETPDAGKPRAADAQVQALMKSRREIPLDRAYSQIVGRPSFFFMGPPFCVE